MSSLRSTFRVLRLNQGSYTIEPHNSTSCRLQITQFHLLQATDPCLDSLRTGLRIVERVRLFACHVIVVHKA